MSESPVMETQDNATASPPPASSTDAPQRRSGRARQAPVKFTPEQQSSQPAQKRKRPTEQDEDGDNQASDGEEQADPDSSDLSEIEEEDDEGADDEPPAAKPKKSKSSSKSTKKPAAKRAKMNGGAPSPSQAPAVRLPARPKKSVKIAIERHGDDGLYSEIFGSGDPSDDVAAQWFHRYQNNAVEAMAELVNTVLLAAGCELKLNEDDIQDADNTANKLSELEEEQTSLSEYPLISRAKSSKNFRDLLLGFFDALISLLHQTDILYNEEDELLEVLQRWVGTMSSSSSRPFRHTATSIGLAMLTSLVEVAKQLDDRIAKSNQALQAESGRKGKNKSLLEETRKALESATDSREIVSDKITHLYEVVFVHRYRDIDPKIRAECIEALGTWICVLPTVYLAPEYLRYLGWLLSDVAVSTRLEVLRQLGRVLRREADNVGHFIDRFRPRLIEIATRDADVSVRVGAISVADILRASGMLEPDEVDSICRLLFDAEVRVRKAVVGFFYEMVQELIESKVDDIGGSDALDEVLGDKDDDDYDSLRKDWINVKALAENLAAYDDDLDDEQLHVKHGLDVAADVVNANIADSRIGLAAQALYEKVPEINNWPVIAGYLLFDHTTSSKSKSKSKASSIETATRNVVVPTPREEAVLLDVLAAAVKESLAAPADHDKNRRRGPRLDADAQEDAGLQLAANIPLLLNKFGSDPAMTAATLRLEHYLDLDVFQQLRQDSDTYEKLLDGITTQFNRHVDQSVLHEAAVAFVHARQYEELEELVDNKLSSLWDNSINALRSFDKSCELSARRNLDRASLRELAQILMRTSKLAMAGNCIDVLEAPGTSIDSEQSAIKVLVGIVHRGCLKEPDEELDDPEDEVVSFAIKTCQFYFMWKVHRLRTMLASGEDIPDAEVDELNLYRKDMVYNLVQTFSSRGFDDDLRILAVGSACDMCCLFVFVREAVNGPQAAKYGKLRPLLEDLNPDLITKELIPIFEAAERSYAKLSKKSTNEPGADEDPLDSDDELPPEDDEDEELTGQERHMAELKAEKILCDLAGKYVLAILAKVVDHRGPHAGKLRKRLNRNKTKLGANYKEVVAYLDEDHLREMRSGKKKTKGGSRPKDAAAGTNSSKKPAISEELAIDDDDDEDDHGVREPSQQPDIFEEEEDEPEEGTAEDLRRRELLDDPIEDDSEEEEERPAAGGDDDDDDVIGD